MSLPNINRVPNNNSYTVHNNTQFNRQTLDIKRAETQDFEQLDMVMLSPAKLYTKYIPVLLSW